MDNGARADAPAPAGRRRQFGADRRTEPLPAVPPPASIGAVVLGRFAVLVTVGAWLGCVVIVISRIASGPEATTRAVIEELGFLAVVSLLATSAMAYILSRQGYLRRTRSHVRVPRGDIEAFFDDRTPTTTVLVPSYREEPEVIRLTLFSAALQELPDLRVTLLVDDPPTPSNPDDQRLLSSSLAVPSEVEEVLAEPRQAAEAALARVESRGTCAPGDLDDLADDYERAAAWLERLAAGWTVHDHVDAFFVNHVVRALARDLAVVGVALHGAAAEEAQLDPEHVRRLARRLVWIFTAELGTFERKRYLGLPADPNKAMNLNAYIGLMGRSYREQQTMTGTALVPCRDDDPRLAFSIRRPDYIITLDADSVLLPEYALRLVHFMEQPANARVGVAQTPYSAFPGAPTRVERIAGATTDVQHIVHQGMATYDAAFWVGANAVLRTDAVEDLRIDGGADGRRVTRFISDRTLIEDTESSLDLTIRGWQITSYPERLAYSATPPDFGSLCIQRRRWANGGLVIMGKLPAHWRARKARGERRTLTELILRATYLGSIAWTTAGLLLLLAYPFDGGLLSGLVLLMSAPYFVVMATDLKRCGYKHTDIVRVYGFNLMMLAVNAAGVARSVVQLVTQHKVAFGRTPKVRHRVVAPATFVLVPYALVALSVYVLRVDIDAHHWAHALFAGANAVILAPAIVATVGLRASVSDVLHGLVNFVMVEPRRPAPVPDADPVADWATVLYYGSSDRGVARRPHAEARAGEPVVSGEVA